MKQDSPKPTSWERHVSCRILHDPICYALNTEVVYLTSSEQSHVLQEVLRMGQSLNWIFPQFHYIWSNISAQIPTGISCGIQDIEPRLRSWPLRVEWQVHLRADSVVWLSHTYSIWSWSGVPKVRLYGTFVSGLHQYNCIDQLYQDTTTKIPLQVGNLYASLKTDDLQCFANFVYGRSCLFNLIIVGFD